MIRKLSAELHFWAELKYWCRCTLCSAHTFFITVIFFIFFIVRDIFVNQRQPPKWGCLHQHCPLCKARGELCGSCCFWMTLEHNFPLISAVVCAVSEEKHRSFLLEGRVTTTCTCAGLSSLPVCNRRSTRARLASARSSGYECSKKQCLHNALVRAVGVFLAPSLLMPHCHAVLWAARCTQVQASFSSPLGCSSAS